MASKKNELVRNAEDRVSLVGSPSGYQFVLKLSISEKIQVMSQGIRVLTGTSGGPGSVLVFKFPELDDAPTSSACSPDAHDSSKKEVLVCVTPGYQKLQLAIEAT